LNTPKPFLLVTAATLLLLRTLLAQASPYRPLDVHSCPAADSALGPVGDDTKAHVRVHYSPARDSTGLTTGFEEGHPFPHLSFETHFAGRRPAQLPAAVLILFLRGDVAKDIQASPAAPTVSIELDDSATVELTPVLKGRFLGAGPIKLPVSALLLPDNLLRVARASKVTVHAGDATVRLTEADHRDVRAFYRAVACPETW
jgi:hypothetical protein